MVAHSRIVLSKCSQFRREGEFTDIRLKVGDTFFPAHRVVLATYSDYFHAIFTDGKEANQEVIEMKDKSFSPEIIKVGPSTLVIFISTRRAYLRFFSQLVSFKLQALFSCVVIS